MIERTRNPDLIKAILLDGSMDEAFAPWAAKLGSVVRDPNNICFTDGLRTCVFIKSPRAEEYSVAVGMLPEGREDGSVEFIRHCLGEVLGAGYAVTCQIDAGNEKAINMAKALNMGVAFTEANGKVYGRLEARK